MMLLAWGAGDVRKLCARVAQCRILFCLQDKGCMFRQIHGQQLMTLPDLWCRRSMSANTGKTFPAWFCSMIPGG